MKERVQKLMAQANIGSRRACEDLISQGRVRVNGDVITLGDKADPQKDIIHVDGERLNLSQHTHVYIALNKPRNVVSTSKVHRGDKRKTIYDLVDVPGHLFAIGRLDADSEGLIVLTNDGDMANHLTHPRYRHTKTYRVTIYGTPTPEALESWREGVFLGEEGRTAPCVVEVMKSEGGLSVLKVIMTEGKKRQIRRVAGQLGYPVRKLVRTHVGKLSLGTLGSGEWRELTPEEVESMKTPDMVLKRNTPAKPRRPYHDRSKRPAGGPPSKTNRNIARNKPRPRKP